ncbi:ABC transporter ATP-binding protein [Methylosinus sp. H3A]|uniref:ABC transporter ATP-binding protein n=1 Tax=Methylosinus sp. H3A TaxID=2785786 RepID=UPI0018C25F4E|nr:ABC transporter ATP-binding protein [Methylosinus sp. H3A]MBG0808278.1 ABC transporter ATP-binding protein [Methylosinus sp. H3A]
MSFADLGGRAAGGGNFHGAPGTQAEVGEEIFVTVDPRTFRRIWTFVEPYRLDLLAAVLAVIAFVGTQVCIPYAIRLSVESIIGTPGSSRLELVLFGFTLLIAANGFTSFLQEVTAARLAQRAIFDMRRAMFVHLQRVSLSFMDRTHVGRIMSRLQGDVNALQEFFETSIAATGDLVLLFGIVGVLLAMEWRLALMTFAVIPALACIRAVWLPYAKAVFSRARDTSSIVNGALAENISGVRVVQGCRREEINLADFVLKAEHNFEAHAQSSIASQMMVPTVDILMGVATATVIIVGGNFIGAGRIDIGVMVAFIFYVQRFFDPIRTVSMQYTMMQRATAAGQRIFEVLDAPVSMIDRPDAQPLRGDRLPIVFENVSFGYHPGKEVLHGIDFAVNANETVALVGPTGSGKTSIASLVHRFYDVWDGRVLVGGVDVRELTQQSLGESIAIVLQEPFLFTGTILDNIRYSSTWATRDEVIAAAKAVRADEFIEALPNGYDTQLEQRGQNLSVGQRQLLSFARALCADPKILILDEATASIDSLVEAEIQRALRVLLAGRTSIIIAHRLATVRDAHRIIVLRDGRIVEQGPHRELLRTGGLYASLYRRNISSFDENG